MTMNKEKGQVLLTVVLVMIVALTVGLSLATRSIVDVRISTEDADSQRALAAAEAGIEQALKELTEFTGVEFSEIGSTYDVQITPSSGSTFLLNNGNLVEKGEGVDIWFVDHTPDQNGVLEPDYSTGWDGNNTLDIYWGTSVTPCENAALEVIVILGPASSPSLKRFAVDPCDTRRSENSFGSPTALVTQVIGAETLRHKLNLSSATPNFTVLLARAVPIYTNAIMGIEGEAALPTQGYAINSTGTFEGTGSQVKRSINVFKQYSQLPVEYFNYGLFSP